MKLASFNNTINNRKARKMTLDIDNLALPKKVLSALSSSIRVNILKLLSRQSPLTFTQIMQMMDLEPTSDAGRFGYHLRELKNSNLIKGDESGYNLTELGAKVVEFVWGLIDYSRSEITKEIPVRTSEYAIEHFDRNKITESLIREAKVPSDLAEEIAKDAEEQLMNAKVKYLTAPLIREVVNSILVLKGYEQYRHNLTRLGLPPFEISRIIKDPKIRQLNATPLSVQSLISDAVLEQYLLLNVLSREVADAYLVGDISFPNPNYFILYPNSIQHDLRPFLNEGLRAPIESLGVSLSPPKSFHQAIMLSLKLLELSQMQLSGSQSIDFFNIFLAPYTKNFTRSDIKENLLLFFTELGSTYVGSGGILPNTTLNLEFEIPPFLQDAPVSNVNGAVYADFEQEARLLLEILLETLEEGTPDGKPFFYPQHIFKIRKNTLTAPENDILLTKLHEVILKWGTPILANLNPDWQTGNVNYTGFFDRLDSSWKADAELDTLRTGNLDCVFINLARIAYESKQDDTKFLELLQHKTELAISALTIKRNQMYSRLFEDHLLPFLTYQVQGENYYHLEHATNAISYAGLPESIEIHTNTKISSKTGSKFATNILHALRQAVIETTKTSGSRWVLRQPFSQIWAERLLQLDNKRFSPLKEQKSKHSFNYYNTSNINSDLSLSLTEKIRLETQFHKYLNGGHMMIVPLSESSSDVNSLLEWTKRSCNADIGLFAYVHDLTWCNQCNKTRKGIFKRCPTCNTTQNIYYHKLIGPYRLQKKFSKSEQLELQTRFKFSL